MDQQGQLRHYIGGTLVEEPIGWADFTEVIERDDKTRLLGVKYPIDLTFTGGAYALLADEYNDNPCQVLDYRSEIYLNGQWEDAAVGKLFLSDIEWNLSRAQAKVSVTDDSIGARIINNRKLDIFPGSTESKNGETITATPSIDLEVFDPQDAIGTYLANTRRAYDWLECVKHLVAFLSDGTVTVVSDWYGDLPDNERWAVIDGDEVRTGDEDQDRLKYNWEGLVGQMANIYDLWVGVGRDDNGDPQIRIETRTYWQGPTVGASFPFTDDLERSVDQDLIYAKVKLGSDKAIKDVSGDYSLPFLIMQGFTLEDVMLRTECNTDAELDLTMDWVVDSNIIEALISAGESQYDDEVVLIQYDHTTDKATKASYLFPGTVPYLYNEAALNINVLNRYSLPADAAVVVGDQTLDGFRAEGTATGSIQTVTPIGSDFTTGFNVNAPNPAEQLQFDDDYTAPNFDTSNAYGNGTVQGNAVSQANSRYTAAAQGYASFTVTVPFEVVVNSYNNGNGVSFGLNIYWLRYDSGNNLVGSGSYVQDVVQPQTGQTTAQLENQGGTGAFSVTYSFGTSLNAGDYLEVYAGIDTGPTAIFGTGSFQWRYLSRSVWRTSGTATGGGVVKEADPAAYYSTVYKFDRHIAHDEWASLKADQSQRVQVGPDGNVVFGYVRKAERNIITGSTTWEVIANRSQE